MQFTITEPNETIITIARKIGYIPIGVNSDNEYSMARPLAGGRGGYPRFHIYSRKESEGVFLINLHLDQKYASYEGSSAHSGEYEGEVVENEATRIKNILDNS
jgi:hypothetical protein